MAECGKPWENPYDERNGSKHHTGKPCIERGCDRPAGTAWSPLWCQPCNAERINRIDARFAEMDARLQAQPSGDTNQ